MHRAWPGNVQRAALGSSTGDAGETITLPGACRAGPCLTTECISQNCPRARPLPQNGPQLMRQVVQSRRALELELLHVLDRMAGNLPSEHLSEEHLAFLCSAQPGGAVERPRRLLEGAGVR